MSLIAFWRGLPARLGRGVLPPRCLVCGGAGQARRDLCVACNDELPWNEPACGRCALPLPRDVDRCGDCLVAPPAYERCIAPLRYAAPLDRLLPSFKFHAGLAQGRLLAQLVLERIDVVELRAGIDVVVPLPLHRSRLGQRGYNQALELARPLASALDRPLQPGLLHRIRATRAQTDLDAAARRRNVRGAFNAPQHRLQRQRVLLVDDVITTGATASEAASTLLAAGASCVWMLATARVDADPSRS